MLGVYKTTTWRLMWAVGTLAGIKEQQAGHTGYGGVLSVTTLRSAHGSFLNRSRPVASQLHYQQRGWHHQPATHQESFHE